MTSPKACILAAVAGVAVAGAAWADSSADLQQQVTELKSQVQQLSVRQAQNSKEVAATIESVLRDAEQRSTLLAAGDSGAGYDNGFYIRSGAFELRPGLNFQFWNVTDYRSNTGGTKDDEIENGFEIHRMQFILEGTAFTKDLTYRFNWNTESDGGSMFLEDAWVKYMFADDWGFVAGQWKYAISHEAVVGDDMQLAVERSLFDALLGSGLYDRVQGAAAIYGGQNEKNPFNAAIAFHDGPNSDNSNYVGHYPNNPSPAAFGSHSYDWGIGARAEFKFSGKWKDYRDFTANGTKEALAVLGGSVDWSQGGNGDVVTGTVDFQFETNNFGFYAALTVSNLDDEATLIGDSQTNWGGLLQGSFAFNPQWEAFARFSYVDSDSKFVFGSESEDKFMELSLGVNYYLGNNGSAGHRAKVTVDLNWLPNGTPGTMTNLGYLGDSGFDNEISLRGQFQLSL